jgi:VanZ family protein
MGAILTATSIPGSTIPDVGFRFADKLVHVVMYGGLGLLLARAVDDPDRMRASLIAIAICVALGAVDEWHQLYIPGRSGAVSDWIADSAGGVLGAGVWAVLSKQRALRRSHV